MTNPAVFIQTVRTATSRMAAIPIVTDAKLGITTARAMKQAVHIQSLIGLPTTMAIGFITVPVML